MDILVIDRDSLTSQLIASKLGARGHVVTVEPNKNLAFDMIRERGEQSFGCVIVDPAPLSEARPVVIGVWKNIRSVVRPYLLLLSKTATTEEAVLSGANDVLNKPLSTQDIETKIGNAGRLMNISQWLAREDNVHSGLGMVGKAAFYQLFLSATDRAFRYGERSLIVFVRMINADEAAVAGNESFDRMIQKLTAQMTFMRRQSDVIGRLGHHDFAILLQRPQYESEPLDALNRFSEVLDKFYHEFDDRQTAPKMQLELVELPQGAIHGTRLTPLPAQVASDA